MFEDDAEHHMSSPNGSTDRTNASELGFVNVDFTNTFPHVFWTSGWAHDEEFPDGFRYKVLSIRHASKGDFEVVVLREIQSGEKLELQRWAVPPDEFNASDELIRMLEDAFAVKFERVDLSTVTTFEAFEAHSRQLGWKVS